MQLTTMKVVNRKIDDDIIAQLDTYPPTTPARRHHGLAGPRGLRPDHPRQQLRRHHRRGQPLRPDLARPSAPTCSRSRSSANGDYVDVKPMTGPVAATGAGWASTGSSIPRLTGSVGAGSDGTIGEVLHVPPLGHRPRAGQPRALDTAVGYHDEQAYSYCRVSGTFGSKQLQNSGIVQIKHNAAAYVAQ
jgi:hypothetical protein